MCHNHNGVALGAWAGNVADGADGAEDPLRVGAENPLRVGAGGRRGWTSEGAGPSVSISTCESIRSGCIAS